MVVISGLVSGNRSARRALVTALPREIAMRTEGEKILEARPGCGAHQRPRFLRTVLMTGTASCVKPPAEELFSSQ